MEIMTFLRAISMEWSREKSAYCTKRKSYVDRFLKDIKYTEILTCDNSNIAEGEKLKLFARGQLLDQCPWVSE